MSTSLSDIFSRNNDTIKIPKNQGDQYDFTTRSGSWIESGGTKAYDKDVVDRAWKLLGDTLSHYPQISSVPEAALKLFGGTVNIDLGSTPSKLGLGDIFGGQAGVVPIPPYMSQEDGQLINWAVNTIVGSIKTASGNLPKPNYELIFRSLSSSDLLNNAVNLLTGDYLKKEFEKGRWPSRLPSLDDSNSIRFYQPSTSSESKPTSLLGAIKQTVKSAIKSYMGIDPESDPNYDAWRIINNATPLAVGTSDNSPLKFDYLNFNDPYMGFEDDITGGSQTIGVAINQLEQQGLLSGYKDFAGFEMGTNHQWKIRIYPYPHDPDDIDKYTKAGRYPITPTLPVYALPNMWRSESKSTSSVPDPSSNKLSLNSLIDTYTNDITYKTIDYITPKIASALDPMYDDNGNSKDVDILVRSTLTDDNKVYFSYSTNTPVLSYDLNFGTIKTDSLKLFNGSQSEIFAGLTYNPVMSISILDDVYGSMFKYIQQYFNCAYSIESHSMAPYYNCAFQIELTILRSGGQINHKYKFIGIPIEYSPRLEGQSDPNECRVDITFSIIGFIPYNKNQKVYGNRMGNRSVGVDPTDINGRGSNDLGDLTWDDIQIKLS